MVVVKIFFLINLIILSTNLCWAKTTITWTVVDYPPYYNRHPLQQNKGILDLVMKEFIKRGEEYKHEKIFVVTKRLMAFFSEAKPKGTYCCAGTIKLPHQHPPYYSQKLFDIPRRVLVVNSSNKKFKNIKKTSLENIIFNLKQTIQVGPDLATANFKHKYKKPLASGQVEFNVSTAPEIRLKKIITNRIDSALIFPLSLFAFLQNHPSVNPKTFKLINIKEYPSPYPVYAYCNKTVVGKKYIKKLDKYISSHNYQRLIKKIWEPYKKLFKD